ncbi:transposase [Nocardia salmonicida]|uniref:transposase n=1 Tax=Nocardia salmonicida TaxID=53431 RepID=UPI0033D945E2
MRATYHRLKVFGTCSVRWIWRRGRSFTGSVIVRGEEFLELLKSLRARWPGERLYVVADNFSPHKRVEVQDWAAAHEVELVFLPTYSSWLTGSSPSSRRCATSR